MNIPANFSMEDWKMISTLPSLIGGATAVASNSGVFGTLKEAMANVKAIMDGANSYPNNSLIQALKPSRENIKDMKAVAAERRAEMTELMKERGVKTPEGMLEIALEDATKANQILAASATPAEADEFRTWVIEIATKVAESAKEGSTFGFGGVQVSEGEQVFIDKLKGVLC